MTNLKQAQDSFWKGFEKLIVFIFLSLTLVTFAFNFTEYAWQHQFTLYTDFVFWVFDIRNLWGLSAWSGILTLLLVPVSLVSFMLLVVSIVIPTWFKRKFKFKYWYGVFIAQILTWILIYNN